MGNKQGSLANHLETASKTGALAFPNKNLDEFPEALSKVSSNLRNLDLSANKISSVPSCIGNFKSLKTLNLGHNRLSRLPEELGQLIKLETLVLCGNRLTQLPAGLNKLKALKELDLSKNRLTEFPLSLTQLRQLNLVDMSGNKLTCIPGDITLLQVTELNLNQNQISQISSELANCPRLKTLRLEENCLTVEAVPTKLLTDSKVSTLCVNGNLFSEKQLADAEGYPKYLERYTAVRRKLD